MTKPEAGVGELDPAEYWIEALRVAELYEIPNDQATDENRQEFAERTKRIDELGRKIADGEVSTGKKILDSVIASGQIVQPERVDELEVIEQMILPGEPLMLQQGLDWRIGIPLASSIYFSRVQRGSFFYGSSRGTQTIPVLSYVEARFGGIPALLEEPHKYESFSTVNIGPDYHPPEVGIVLGMPIKDYGSGPASNKHDTPSDVKAMIRLYVENYGSVDVEGWYGFEDVFHVGKAAVEANLGMELTELVELEPNNALEEYLNASR